MTTTTHAARRFAPPAWLLATLTLAPFALHPDGARAQARPGAAPPSAVVAASAAPAPSPAPAPPPAPPAISPFDGVWRWIGGAAEVAARDAAIDRTVSGMGWIIEGIAAGRLRERNDIAATITIAVRDGRIDVLQSNRPRVVTRDGEGTPLRTPHGEQVVVTQRMQNGVLVRFTQASQGARREEFRLAGATLAVLVTVTSPRLPRALTYRLTYRR